MLKKYFIITTKSLFVAFCIICLITACNKKDEQKNLSQGSEGEKYVPFFEVAKGDSISKSIFREKPDLNSDSVTILFSTENKLKAQGNSSGNGYIRNLYVSIRSDNNVGNYLWDGLTKIPVDLNEGAGGKWIYLFYAKGYTGEEFEYAYNFEISNSNSRTLTEDRTYVQGYNGSADLNDGAGGAYVYLIVCRNGYYDGKLTSFGSSPVRDILIASSNRSNITISGWFKVPGDLNKGAGGKYIYLFFKR